MQSSSDSLSNKQNDNGSESKARTRPQTNKEVQYYKPPGSCDEAQDLLEREDLTEQDVLDFVYGRELRKPKVKEGQKLQEGLIKAYHKRRREILDLAQKLWEQKAYVDEDGRLVPVTEDDDNLPGDLPPLPNRNDGNNNNPRNNNFVFGRANNNDNANDAALNNNNNNNFLLINNNNIPFPLDQEEEERRWIEQEEQEAELAIARAVQRYQQQGVSQEEYVLLKVQPADRPERASLTFRRICFAVLAVVTAFICIMLQTLPLFPRDPRPDPIFDKLLYELAEVRHFPEHAKACPGLHRSASAPQPWSRRLRFWDNQQSLDCSNGVLHVPSKSVFVDSFFESPTQEASFWEPYVLGVNVSWFLPCNPPGNSSHCQAQLSQDSCQAPHALSDAIPPPAARCFRGIHDNMITDHEVGDALRMGAELISEGGDHFDIHDNVILLQDRLPTLLNTIRSLLRDSYMVQGKIQPVAFRVSAVGPLDGNGVALRGSHSQTSNYLLRILNRQKYIRWIEKYKRHNELARYSLPWPSRLKAFRDPCHLMADMEANSNFNFHTSIFLSNGAGRDFRGGVSLYVDDHKSNENPRRKIQRGVTIDGSRGRLVVSTGGLENRRCRLPTREGVRAALQIWWSCDTESGESAC